MPTYHVARRGLVARRQRMRRACARRCRVRRARRAPSGVANGSTSFGVATARVVDARSRHVVDGRDALQRRRDGLAHVDAADEPTCVDGVYVALPQARLNDRR